MKFSIIIPVRQINDYLRENISQLKLLQYAEFEVLIIVDTPETYDFGGDARFKILVSGPVGPGEKRNIGAKKACGQVLAFLDDDAFPASDWLLEASKLFDNPNLYALGGPALTPLNAGFLEKVSGHIIDSYLVSGNTAYRQLALPQREIDDYPSVNLLVRKEAFDSVGGFNTEFWPGEDTKLCLDLVKKYKRKFLYSPRVVVFHHRRNAFRPLLKQLSRYGRHRGQFAKIFPETSLHISYFIPSLFVLGLFGGVVTFMFSGMFRLLNWIYVACVLMYGVLLSVESIKVFFKSKNVKMSLYFSLGVFLVHLVYGVNIIIGLLSRPKLVLKAVDQKTGNYSEG